VPAAAPLRRVALVFASGTAGQNQLLPERFAVAHPTLQLCVVSEFQPHRGEWIPWHVLRSSGENVASIRAALQGCHVEAAAMALAKGTGYARMRAVALRLAAGSLVAFDEDLKIVPRAALPLWFLRSMAPVEGGRAHKWLRRLAHPAESEIPLRARLAQMKGLLANRLRGQAREVPLRGQKSLAEGVSIVVPSRDGRELLAAMLPPLLPQLLRGEMIVVDNGSGDGTAAWLADTYPEVRVLPFPAPLSFARAVNAGILQARYRRTLLLNNDMVVEPGFIAALEEAFEQIPDLYCATAQIFFPPGVRREETGKAVWRRDNPLDFPMRCDDPSPGEDLTWVFYGSGGCSLFDTAKLCATGGVAEVYEPAYVEDMDFGYRAWKRGWPTVYCAGARAEHRHRATTARFYTPRQLDFFVERNYLRFLIHAVSSPPLFEKLWLEAIRRLQLLAMNGSEPALDALRAVPRIGPRPAPATGVLSESEIFALGNGDIACFPGLKPSVRPSMKPRAKQVILIATPYLPFPLSHGGAVRIFNLMKYAAASHDLVLMAYCDELAAPAPEVLALCREVVLVKRHGTHYRRATTRPDVVEEFDSETFRACLKQTASRWKPAVLQLEFTWMAQFADACPGARTILVEHDITFDLQEQLLRSSTETGAARWELERQAGKWRSFETRAWRAVDCVVTMSAKDCTTVKQALATQTTNNGAEIVATLPNGVDCERFQPSPAAPEPRRLLFIGSFAHLPNLLALEFFFHDVWPLLKGAFTLQIIAGANPDYYLDFHRRRVSVDLLQPGIELEGFVADVRTAYQRAELVLAPLTASAGTNIKVLEAMAMGRAVVSTPAGVNGLDLKPGTDVIVAANATSFADEIEALSADSARRLEIEKNARQTALRYDWSAIAERQDELYRELSS
jgi:GT2 family glycosyltransferase/glycosyltransferase involved in cell wall biosynthesis